MKHIRKVIENKNKAEKERNLEISTYPCEEILGSMKTVKEFAGFYVTHKTDLEVVKMYFQIQYCDAGIFTPDQYNSYKMGMEAMMKIFEDSEADVNLYITQAEIANSQQKKKSVG